MNIKSPDESQPKNDLLPLYVPNPVHRNRTPNKSQWKISLDDEHRSFRLCVEREWCDTDVGWGLHLEGGDPVWLGVTRDGKTRTFFAKFVNNSRNEWHGYPADHVSSSKDIPKEFVQHSWIKKQLLSTAKVRKIARGQSCSL